MTRIGIDFYSGYRFRLEGEKFGNRWSFKLKQLGGEVDLPKFLAASVILKTAHAISGVKVDDFSLDELAYEGKLAGDQDDVHLYMTCVGDEYMIDLQYGDDIVRLPGSLATFAKEKLALTLNNLAAELIVGEEEDDGEEKEEKESEASMGESDMG